MDDLTTLEQQAAELGARISEIKEAQRQEELQPYVGRYFKTQNNYSCPEGPEDYWWLYIHVTGLDGFSLTGFQFQRDNDGRSTAEASRSIYIHSDYEEIDAGEWGEAWDAFCEALAEDEAQ